MKRSVAVLVLVGFPFAACRDQPLGTTDDPTAPVSAAVSAVNSVLVQATGDPAQDWANLTAALNADYDLVELGAGTFVLGQPVQAQDFSGTLSGAGVDQTTIEMAPGVEFGLTTWPNLNQVPVFISFAHLPGSGGDFGRVVISDMTMLAAEFTEEWFYYGLPSNFMLTTVEVLNQNAVFENLRLTGREDPAYPYFGFSIRHGVLHTCLGELGVTESDWRRIEVEYASNGIVTWDCPGTAATIGGGPKDGVHVTNSTFGIVSLLWGSAHVSHSHLVGRSAGIGFEFVQRAEVTDNRANSIYAYNLADGKISHNKVEQVVQVPPWAGVEVYDSNVEISRNEILGTEQVFTHPFYGCNPFGPVFLSEGSEAMVVDNEISTETSTTDCAAAFVEWGQNGTFRSNRLAGALEGDPHLAGIYLGFADNWNIRDNNVSQLETCPDIYLSGWSSNNVVVGNRHTTVLDEGTNNTLQNVGPYDCPAAAFATGTAQSGGDWQKLLQDKRQLMKDRFLISR